MIGIFGKSIKVQLMAIFLIVALAPICVLGYLAYTGAAGALEEAVLEKLQDAMYTKKAQVMSYMAETLNNLRFLAASPPARAAVEILTSFHEGGRISPDARFDTKSDLYKKISQQIDLFFNAFLGIYKRENAGYEDVLLMDTTAGHIMYSTGKGADLGENVKTGALRNTELAKVWRQVVKTGKPAMTDFALYEPSESEVAFLAAPVMSMDGKVSSVLALKLSKSFLERIIGEREKRMKGANMYLVRMDRFILASSVVQPKDEVKPIKTAPKAAESQVETATAKPSASEKAPVAIKQGVLDTDAAKSAVDELSGSGIFVGRDGAKVLAAFTRVGLKDDSRLGAHFDWSLLVQAPVSRAFAPARSLATRIVGAAVLLLILVGLTAFVLATTISKPMTMLAEHAAGVSQGDLTGNVPTTRRKDEIGQLTDSFSSMVANLRAQTAQILEGINVLAASASEISTTSAQLASSASRTATAVTQTTTTVAEVKQAAKVVNERAQKVAETATHVVRVSEEGQKATEETVERMNQISDQMTSVGETVVSLSQSSQAIENIIAAVNDLTEQSNLLAVNAAIEAARAGEHGKGFAVVAQEIKALADQSREATRQVRSILEDVRKSIAAVVMATEQGIKSVESGVEQSQLAGEAIQALTDGVSEASRSATVIVASTEQQFVGVDQVSSAMANVELAMKQNVDGTYQLEQEAGRLQEVGVMLKDLVGNYKI